MYGGQQLFLTRLPCVPDVAGRGPRIALSKRRLRVALIVYIHVKVVAKREAEAVAENVAVAGDKAREHRLGRPRLSTVGRRSVIDVPVRLVALVHPGNADVARRSRPNRRKRGAHPGGAREISGRGEFGLPGSVEVE